MLSQTIPGHNLLIFEIHRCLKYYCKIKLASQIYVKPDLTPDERTIESLLLKERKLSIEKGTSRQHIKIRNSCLYIHMQQSPCKSTKSLAFVGENRATSSSPSIQPMDNGGNKTS